MHCTARALAQDLKQFNLKEATEKAKQTSNREADVKATTNKQNKVQANVCARRLKHQ